MTVNYKINRLKVNGFCDNFRVSLTSSEALGRPKKTEVLARMMNNYVQARRENVEEGNQDKPTWKFPQARIGTTNGDRKTIGSKANRTSTEVEV